MFQSIGWMITLADHEIVNNDIDCSFELRMYLFTQILT